MNIIPLSHVILVISDNCYHVLGVGVLEINTLLNLHGVLEWLGGRYACTVYTQLVLATHNDP